MKLSRLLKYVAARHLVMFLAGVILAAAALVGYAGLAGETGPSNRIDDAAESAFVWAFLLGTAIVLLVLVKSALRMRADRHGRR